MPTSDHQGPIGTSISIMLVGRFWRVLKKCWSGIISNASHPSPKFSPFWDCPPDPGTVLFGARTSGLKMILELHDPVSRDHQGIVPKPEIKFWYCITQGYETQEFWRSETTGKSDSSESMTFRYIPDMINLPFFIWKVKIKGMQLYLSTYIFWNYTFHLSRHEQGSNIGKSFVSSVSYGAHAKNIFSSLKILA